VVRRERTYSDSRIIDLLNERFIPAAVNINMLQRQDDDEGQYFRTISWQGRFKLSFEEARARMAETRHRECHQGQYVATTEGELLGSRHTADVEQLLEILHGGLANWEDRKTQRDVETIEEVDRDARYVWTYPEDGLVLHLGCTDLPRKVDLRPDDWRRMAHNQDFVWFTREEMLALIPEGVKTGDRFPLPEIIHRRLVRYHMLDIVRGETQPWPKANRGDVALELQVVEADSQAVNMVLNGGGTLREGGKWCTQPPRESVYRRGDMCCLIEERGFEAGILGYLDFDRVHQRFARFDVLVIGTRWGGTTHNVRCSDVDAAPLGIAMTLAGGDRFDRIPPHGSPGSYFNA
jgi:hypothetical protein